MARSGRPNGSLAQDDIDHHADSTAFMARVAQAMEMMAQAQTEMTRAHTEVLNRQVVAQPRAGNISDFRRLNPPFFRGTEKPLEAEQWLIQTGALLTAAMIPDLERVNVVSIQLLDNAQTWWQTEGTRYHAPTWEDFRRAFLIRFFPRTAASQMAREFTCLTQGSRTVDEYASEFSRLSRFAPRLVATDEDRARRFEEGLRIELQRHVVSFHYPTYVEVLDAAREHEQLTLRYSSQQSSHQQGQFSGGVKRPLQQGPQRQELAKRPAVGPSTVCGFCGRSGHTQKFCRRANGQCLACGATDHQLQSCPKRRSGSDQPVSAQTQLPFVPAQRPPLPPQQQRERLAQTGRAYDLIVEPTDAMSDEVAGVD